MLSDIGMHNGNKAANRADEDLSDWIDKLVGIINKDTVYCVSPKISSSVSGDEQVILK